MRLRKFITYLLSLVVFLVTFAMVLYGNVVPGLDLLGWLFMPVSFNLFCRYRPDPKMRHLNGSARGTSGKLPAAAGR
jgi:hypothetical protein